MGDIAIQFPDPWSIGEKPYEDHVFGADGFEVASAPQAYAIHRDFYADRMGGGHWATTDGACREVGEDEGARNARLIAALPALLAAAWTALVDLPPGDHASIAIREGLILAIAEATGLEPNEVSRAALAEAEGRADA